MEIIQTSLNWGRDKQTVAHSYNRTLLSNKKEQNDETCNNADKSQMHCAKKPDPKGYMSNASFT